MPRIVISDTIPIHYLVLIAEAELLPLLYRHYNADLVLMDERDGVEEARRLGLTVTGTLGALDRAAERGLIDLNLTFAHLRQTNFHINPALLEQLLAADAQRQKG